MAPNSIVLERDMVLEDTVGTAVAQRVVPELREEDLHPTLLSHLNERGQPDTFAAPDLDRLGYRIEVYVLDYSNTLTGTHKGLKAKTSLDECLQRGANIALFGNFSSEKRKGTEGSGMDALEVVAAHYDSMQVIGFVPSDSPTVNIDEVEYGKAGKRKKIRIGIDCNEYLSGKRLEEIFRNCILGEAVPGDSLSEFYQSQEAASIAPALLEMGIDPHGKSLAVTNLAELPQENEALRFEPVHKAYGYDTELREELCQMDVIISTVGSAERFLGQLGSFAPTFDEYGGRTAPIHIFVTTPGNPLGDSPIPTSNEGVNRLDTPYDNPCHAEVMRYAIEEGYMVRYMVAGDDEKTTGSGIASMLRENVFPDLEVSTTGALAFSALSKRNCTRDSYGQRLSQKDKEALDQSGIMFNNLNAQYLQDDGQIGSMMKQIILPDPGSRKLKICIVNTGSSTNPYLS